MGCSAPPPQPLGEGRSQGQAPTSLFAGSSQSWERLKAKQQRTLEGRREEGQLPAGRFCPTPQATRPGLQKPRVAGASPELALNLDPARATQEGPGLVPLLHCRQAGAEHLQPQVQDLLAGHRQGWGYGPDPSRTTGRLCPPLLAWALGPFPPPQLTHPPPSQLRLRSMALPQLLYTGRHTRPTPHGPQPILPQLFPL